MNSAPAIRRALVTGAGRGLGRAFCLRLAQGGWYVAVTDVDGPAAEATLADVVSGGGRGEAVVLDVTDADAWTGLRERLRQQWPRLDLLVNNAGVSGSGEIGESLDEFRKVFEVNYFGTLNGCHAMVPWLKETAPGGHIVNIASVFGLFPPPTLGAYAGSKAAVIALSETLFGELQPHRIGVTVVAPGFFSSQLLDDAVFAKDVHRQIAVNYMRGAELTADEIVEHTLAAVEREQLHVVLGRKARWVWRLKRLWPGWTMRRVAGSYRGQLRKFEAGD